jgi:chaperone BCS1
MYSIELSHIEQIDFLQFVSKNTEFIDIKNYLIYIEDTTEKKSNLLPGYGEYKLKYNEDIFDMIYKQEGKPHGDTPRYYSRMTIKHENLKILKSFLTEALTYNPPAENKKIKVHTSCGKGYWESRTTVYSQTLDEIYIPSIEKDQIIKCIDNFITNKPRYIKFGRTYKTSFLLTGVPGSGKSSIAKAIALKYNRRIYVLNFTKNLTDDTLISLFSDINNDSILLLEDIDAYFIDRKAQDVNVSFSVLINCLDGVLSKGEGLIIFITANNPDRLDPALLRPGRVDKIIKFDYPKKKEIEEAFYAITEQDSNDAQSKMNFNKFYEVIKSMRISMSGIIDYLFRNPTEYMEHIDKELIQQNHYLQEMTSEKIDKLYT